ncbi:HEAT repeat domain-containing protein [Verrucomicrobiota bacterium]
MNRLAALGIVLVMVSGAADSGYGGKIRVGFYKDARSASVDVFREHLSDKFDFEIIDKKYLKTGKLDVFDVLFFTGGWNAYGWAWPAETRLNISRYVARGGGVLLSHFRVGIIRNDQRVMFPEIGYGGPRIGERLVKITDARHPVTKGVAREFLNGYGEHIMLHAGEEGMVLGINSGDKPVLIAGEHHHGRVVLYGSYIYDLYSVSLAPHGANVILPEEKKLVENALRWLAGGKKVDKLDESYDLSFWRREKLMDEMIEDASLAGREMGMLSMAYWDILEPLDRYHDQTAYYNEVVPGKDLAQFVAAVDKLKKQLKKRKRAIYGRRESYIKGLDLAGLKGLDSAEHLEEFKASLLSLIDKSGVHAQWKSIDKKYRPLVAAKLRTNQAEELRKDRQQVPVLIAGLKDEHPESRRKAVVELGRIGDVRAAGPLIGLLQDSDDKVRVSVIQALGWLKTKKAVPMLVKLSQDKEPKIRRRVAETLGVIGDPKAYDTLVALLKDSDHYTRENAIYSLGWLRDEKSVPVLFAHYEKAGRGDCRGMAESAAVIRALGAIGSEKALPFLKEIQGDCDGLYTMFPAEKGSYRAFYLQSGSLKEHAFLAVKEIESGKKGTPGIEQPVFQSSRVNFNWFSDYYRPIVGRYRAYLARPYDALFYPSYLRALGAAADILPNSRFPSDKRLKGRTYDEFLDECDLLGVKMMDYIPRTMLCFQKSGAEAHLRRFGRHPSLAGFWAEEIIYGWDATHAGNRENAWYPSAWVKGRVTKQGLRKHLEQKYSPSFLKKEGITDDFWKKFVVPGKTEEMLRTRKEQPFIWAELVEYHADVVLENWEEWVLWVTGRRKGTVATWSNSETLKAGASNYIKVYPNLCKIFTAAGPQSYNEHSYKNVFQAELAQDGEVRPVMPEIYAWYSPGLEYVRRGIATSYFHGGAFFEFYIGQIQRYGILHWPSCWMEGRWDMVKEMFQKGNRLSEYLMPVSQPTETALLYSGRANDLMYGRENPIAFGYGKCGGRYFQNQQGLWQALTQAHVPVTVIWAETLTAEKLAPYKVLVLSNALSLKEREVAIIREWVKEGGCLIASGSSTLYDDWGRRQDNYRLADVFGVARTGSTVPYVYDPEHTQVVELQIKPATGIGKIISADFPVKEAECYSGLGYEKVKPTTARIVAAYQNSDVALTQNSFGQGSCFYLTLEYPGLSHTPWRYSGAPQRKTYWPGTLEFLQALVEDGLKTQEEEQLLKTRGCPEYVEVAVRRQDDKQRWMVHAMNYDPTIMEVETFTVSLKTPSLEGLNMERPYTNEKIPYQVKDGRLEFEFKNLRDHQMAVVSWEKE